MDIISNKLTKSVLIALILIIGISGCKKDEASKTTPTSPNFCYSLTTSNSAYDSIVGGTELVDFNSDYFYEVILPFHFTFCDSTFDTLFIPFGSYYPTFSYIVYQTYTDAQKYELLTFGNLNLETGDSSKLIYNITGVTGDRITTIEWKKFIYNEPFTSVNSTFSFQIKLYENGNKIEFHYGPNDITTDFAAVGLSQLAVGLYSDDLNDGLFLSGNYSSPTTTSTVGNKELSTWPTEGTKYLFQ